MKKRVLPVLVLLVGASAGAYLYGNGRKTPDTGAIRVSGNIEATDAEVSFKVAGRVETRLASEGQTVRAGDLVARLDQTELAQEAGLRQAEVRAAAADLAGLEAGSRPEEIAQGRAALDLAEAEAERLRLDSARQQWLHQQDVISSREYEASATAYAVAQARVRGARQQLALLQEGPRQEEIAQARARLDRARQALAVAETRLKYATLRSPISGIVLSENIEAGEYVNPGTPVVTIGDLERVWLRAYINETDLTRVKIGQRVRLTTDAYPGESYWGHVSFIASEAEFTPKNVQTEKERVKLVYRIKVVVPNPNLELKPGMPADAEVSTETADRPAPSTKGSE